MTSTTKPKSKLSARLDQAERAAFEAMKWKAAHEASTSDDASHVASIKGVSTHYLKIAERIINTCLIETDPVEFDDPYAVLVFAAGVREGII